MSDLPLDRFEKEIEEARVLITDDEIKAGNANNVDTPVRIFSRAVERVEDELVMSMRFQ